MKDKLKGSQANMYQFYSISTFNLTLTLIYGSINVTVMTPDKTAIKRSLSSTITPLNIVVPASSFSASQQVDYFD